MSGMCFRRSKPHCEAFLVVGRTNEVTWCSDFAHCICDSLEGITCARFCLGRVWNLDLTDSHIRHSLCTTEFTNSRQSYEWLCFALDIYTPKQYEYGRLNLTHTILSKRKLLHLVEGAHVEGWDDPRLYTLKALRRRGVPPGAIISFINSTGVSPAITSIPITRFEQSVREFLENTVPRLMMVRDPVLVTIENFPSSLGEIEWLDKPLHPKNPSLGSRKIPFTSKLYIDRSDFRIQPSPNYFRLCPGRSVGLIFVDYPITCTDYITDDDGEVTESRCRYEHSVAEARSIKPKAFIQWLAVHTPSGSPIPIAETRASKSLFKSSNPSAASELARDINPDSLLIHRGALLELGFWDFVKGWIQENQISSEKNGDLVHKERVRFQAYRTAYFALDRESIIHTSTPEKCAVRMRRKLESF
jgi:glutaminyl-tRNA synthetase